MERHHSQVDLINELAGAGNVIRWTRLSVAVTCFSLLGSLPLAAQNAAPSVPEGRTASVVVLPFANITGESGDEWIGAGIAEALVTDLEGQVFAVIGLSASSTCSAPCPATSWRPSRTRRSRWVGVWVPTG